MKIKSNIRSLPVKEFQIPPCFTCLYIFLGNINTLSKTAFRNTKKQRFLRDFEKKRKSLLLLCKTFFFPYFKTLSNKTYWWRRFLFLVVRSGLLGDKF